MLYLKKKKVFKNLGNLKPRELGICSKVLHYTSLSTVVQWVTGDTPNIKHMLNLIAFTSGRAPAWQVQGSEFNP
jgi:hypothetical protein